MRLRHSALLLTLTPWLHARAESDYGRDIRPLLQDFCISCHSTEKQKGDLDLERFATVQDIAGDAGVWEKVAEQLASGEMPPEGKPQLSAEGRTRLTDWVGSTLHGIALTNAGDPGPVVLRRLSNAEYSYTIRDLTGIPSLDPLREFPIDGAAGEGFTNAGAALVMSPALLAKYLDAGREIASHAVLDPDGIRFSSHDTARDWTDETLAAIRGFYARYSEAGGASAVNLQGIQFDTNAGGRLPVEKYVSLLVQEKTALTAGTLTLSAAAEKSGLNAKYLGLLWAMLHDSTPSPLLDALRAKWQDGSLAAADIAAWQGALWRFASVGHIGKVNGPKSWQEPVTPLAPQTELRVKPAPPAGSEEVTLWLSTGDAGDGADGDIALWENARLTAPGRPDLPLRDLRRAAGKWQARQDAVRATAARCLAAAAEADQSDSTPDVAALAGRHDVDPAILTGWLDLLGIHSGTPAAPGTLLTGRLEGTADYPFITGWTGADALSVLANPSDSPVRVPGEMKPHSIAVHPSPSIAAVVAWRSPAASSLHIHGSVQDAHTSCGNGIAWRLEVRRGHTRDTLAAGVSDAGNPVPFGPFENVRVQPGDLIALVIDPRDGEHTCDLTAVDLVLTGGTGEWNLAADISPDILAANPHPDRQGNAAVWHFAGEPAGAAVAPVIPAESALARWRRADPALRNELAGEVQQSLQTAHAPLLAMDSPLMRGFADSPEPDSQDASSPWGLDPALFGRHPLGGTVDPGSLCVHAPSLLAVRIPAAFAAGAELAATGRLHPDAAPDGSVQMQILTAPPENASGLTAGATATTAVSGLWSDNNLRTVSSAPVIVRDGSAARQRFEDAFAAFRQIFPAALCYTKIVPVDEVVTLTLYYREDEALQRLMLEDAQRRELDRLWDSLLFVSKAPLQQVDSYEQLYQFATQDADPSAFAPMREPILREAAAFRKRQTAAEPVQVAAIIDFATRVWRRPLTDPEQAGLRALYQELRTRDLPHEAAARLLLARLFVAPAFLYRGESAAPGDTAAAVSDWELATRLSYFLWASAPDDELRAAAAAGTLHEPDTLLTQTRRMLRDPRVRRLATEFGCQWLHVRDLDTLDEKSERHFPTFAALRADMQEETIRFFLDLFQEDRSVLSLLDADYTFVNKALAEHYQISLSGEDWQRVDGQHARGRGGILGFASTLARQSGASRTSPILRGNWVSEVILGEKLPRPPKGVPILPEEAPAGLTERQLIERHSSDAACARCHQRIDPFGYSLEGFDAIGRARATDAAGLPVNTRTTLPDGTEIDGLDGLRTSLLTTHRAAFLRQFSRKLLGYALGRSVQLSDQPLLDDILTALERTDFRVSTAVERIVNSPQFRNVRGRASSGQQAR